MSEQYNNNPNESYGSNSYSNYDYGATAQTNSYGSYHYGNGYSPEGNASQAAPQQTQGYYQYGASDVSGAQTPEKKKGRGWKVALALLLIVCLLGGGGYAAYRIAAGSRADVAGTSPFERQGTSSDAVQDIDDLTPEEYLEGKANGTLDGDMEDGTAEPSVVQLRRSEESQIVVTDVTEVYRRVIPSIVAVDNNYTESVNYFGHTFSEDGMSTASGIIIAESEDELLIATNHHVVENANSLSVHFVDEAEVPAHEKGSDADMDLAVIAVKLSDIDSDTYNAIAIATLGNSDTLQAGEPAIVIGNALGIGQSVTTGVISAPARVIVDEHEMSSGPYIQTDAAINPGNSGGALLNSRGEVVGITVSKLADVRVEGMGYAIPISKAEPIIGDLMNMETKISVPESERGYLGISGFGVTSDMAAEYDLPRGAYVRNVREGGAADKAGIIADDIITKVNGRRVASMEELQKELSYYRKGEQVEITLMRELAGEFESMEVTVTLGSAKEAGIEN